MGDVLGFRDAARAGRFVFDGFRTEGGTTRTSRAVSRELSHLADRFRVERFVSPSGMIDTCYSRAEERGRLEEYRRMLAREVGARLERTRRKLEAQREELARAGQSERLRRQGELLTANLSLFGNGPLRTESVRAIDYYDPKMAEVEVGVDPSLSASANAQVLFARYARAQRALEAVAANILATEGDIAYLESVASLVDMAEISNTLIDPGGVAALGYWARGGGSGPGRRGAWSRQTELCRRDTARSGHEIYVGRNNLQNDYSP